MNSSLAPDLDLGLIDGDEALASLGKPGRRRILEALASAPDSATGLAERFQDSRQRINYHLKALEAAGLVELAEERPRRGLTEKIYRPVSRRFALDPSILGSLDAGESIDEGDRWAAAYAVALASRTTREIARLRAKAAREGRRLAVASLDTTVRLGSPKAMEAFVEDLARAFADVVARHDDRAPGARPFRVISCSHPAPDESVGPGKNETEE